LQASIDGNVSNRLNRFEPENKTGSTDFRSLPQILREWIIHESLNINAFGESRMRRRLQYSLLYGCCFTAIFVLFGCYDSVSERGTMSDPHDSDELPPIHQAAEDGDLERVRALLDEDPSQIQAKSPIGNTPLHLAASQGHVDVVRELLDRGADIQARGDYERQPLHNALKNGYVDVVKLLLERGADPNAIDDFGRAIEYVASGFSEEDERLYKLMIEHGAKIDVFIDMGRGSCEKARQYFREHPEFVASLPKESREGLVSLAMSTLWQRYSRITDKLDPYTPLEEQARILQGVIDENRDIVDLLIEQGATRRVPYEQLWDHAQSEEVELVRLMLEYGAETKPSPGRELSLTLEEIARGSPRGPEMLALLREYKAIE
jgi:hypothetical protein